MSEHTWDVLAAEAEKDGSKLGMIVAALCRTQSMQYRAKVSDNFKLTPDKSPPAPPAEKPPQEKPAAPKQHMTKVFSRLKGKKR
jgi:hypothetical protein